MGQGINNKDIEEIENSFARSGFLHKVFSFPQMILGYVLNCFLYGPGVGKVSVEKILKHKVARIDTSVGDIRVPIVKMPCFDLSFGFFKGNVGLDTGLYNISEFLKKQRDGLVPENIQLNSYESYWIINFRRPKDVFGKNDVVCFIENQLDGLIYIRHICENQLIDYEKIIMDYENEIDNLDFMERMEREIVKIEPPQEFLEDGCRKRTKTEEPMCQDGYCFNENSTTPKTANL